MAKRTKQALHEATIAKLREEIAEYSRRLSEIIRQAVAAAREAL